MQPLDDRRCSVPSVTGCYIKLVDISSRDLLPTPLHLVSEQFTSKFCREVSKLLGVKQCLSSSRHPQSDGQSVM